MEKKERKQPRLLPQPADDDVNDGEMTNIERTPLMEADGQQQQQQCYCHNYHQNCPWPLISNALETIDSFFWHFFHHQRKRITRSDEQTMSPFEKFRHYGLFPWKMFLNVTIFALIAILVFVHELPMSTADEKARTNIINLFLNEAGKSRSGDSRAITLSAGDYASFPKVLLPTRHSFVESIAATGNLYYRLVRNSVARYYYTFNDDFYTENTPSWVGDGVDDDADFIFHPIARTENDSAANTSTPPRSLRRNKNSRNRKSRPSLYSVPPSSSASPSYYEYVRSLFENGAIKHPSFLNVSWVEPPRLTLHLQPQSFRTARRVGDTTAAAPFDLSPEFYLTTPNHLTGPFDGSASIPSSSRDTKTRTTATNNYGATLCTPQPDIFFKDHYYYPCRTPVKYFLDSTATSSSEKATDAINDNSIAARRARVRGQVLHSKQVLGLAPSPSYKETTASKKKNFGFNKKGPSHAATTANTVSANNESYTERSDETEAAIFLTPLSKDFQQHTTTESSRVNTDGAGVERKVLLQDGLFDSTQSATVSFRLLQAAQRERNNGNSRLLVMTSNADFMWNVRLEYTMDPGGAVFMTVSADVNVRRTHPVAGQMAFIVAVLTLLAVWDVALRIKAIRRVWFLRELIRRHITENKQRRRQERQEQQQQRKDEPQTAATYNRSDDSGSHSSLPPSSSSSQSSSASASARRSRALLDSKWRRSLRADMGFRWHVLALVADAFLFSFVFCAILRASGVAFSQGMLRIERVLIGMAALSSGLLLVSFLRYFPSQYLLIRTMGSAVPEMLMFLVGVAPLFLSFVLFFLAAFGWSSKGKLSTFLNSSITLYMAAFGDTILPFLQSVAYGTEEAYILSLLGATLGVIFVLSFMWGVMNVALAIVVDKYVEVRDHYGMVEQHYDHHPEGDTLGCQLPLQHLSDGLLQAKASAAIQRDALDVIRQQLRIIADTMKVTPPHSAAVDKETDFPHTTANKRRTPTSDEERAGEDMVGTVDGGDGRDRESIGPSSIRPAATTGDTRGTTTRSSAAARSSSNSGQQERRFLQRYGDLVSFEPDIDSEIADVLQTELVENSLERPPQEESRTSTRSASYPGGLFRTSSNV